MTAKTSPFLGVSYGWDFGESGWNTGMDQNLLSLSAVSYNALDGIVTSLPTTVVNGSLYFLTTDNRTYFAVGGNYFSMPTPIFKVFTLKSSGDEYKFNGTNLVLVPSQEDLEEELEALQSSLGTAAYEDTSAFISPSDLSSTTKGQNIIANGIQTVDTVAQLRAISKTSVNLTYRLLGFYTRGDCSPLDYYLDTSDTTSVDNPGLVVVGTDGGRFKALYSRAKEPRDFGAKGDGVTDDTVAVKAWVLACSGDRGQFGTGIFSITDLDIPENTSLEGKGPGATIILHATGGLTTKFISMASNGGSSVKNLSINGNSVSGFVGAELDLSGANTPNIAQNVYVYATTSIGISNAALGAIYDCWLYGPNSATTGGTFGVWCDGANANTVVSGCFIKNWRLNGVFQGGNCSITGCIFENNHQQVSVGGGQVASGLNLKRSVVSNNIFKASPGAGSHGIELDNAPTIFTNNFIESMGGYGVILQTTNGHVVNSNYIGPCGITGVQVNAGISAFTINSNKIIGSPKGINIATGASDYFTVEGNVLLGNTTPFTDTSTGTDKVVNNNAGYLPGGTITVGASPFTYTNTTGTPITVQIFGGTVSNVTVSGRTSATSTGVQVNVARKQSVVVTYSSAPSMEFVGN